MIKSNQELFTFVGNILYELIHIIIFIIICLLSLIKIIDQGVFLVISIILVSSLAIKHITAIYLNFILAVRSGFGDNRTANFLSFDVLKFILVLISLISIIILGLNKVLNNETIATLLGGLVGSLLTMRGSYTDLKFTKEEKEELNKTINNQPSQIAK